MSNTFSKAEKLAVAVISVLFLGWVIIQNHQQNSETEQRFIQVNAALNRLNVSLERNNALQARQVSLGEQSAGMLIDTRNAVLEREARHRMQDSASNTGPLNQNRVSGGRQ